MYDYILLRTNKFTKVHLYKLSVILAYINNTHGNEIITLKSICAAN